MGLFASGSRADLLLLDVNLPGMSGVELCRRIRTLAHLQDTPGRHVHARPGAGKAGRSCAPPGPISSSPRTCCASRPPGSKRIQELLDKSVNRCRIETVTIAP